MGLFDSLAGQVLGSLSGASGSPHAGLLEAIGGLVSQHGGLAGLVGSFERSGLGHIAASWVGTGANLPITAEQLQSVLGSGQLGAIATSLGLTPQEVSGHLAQLLPQVVDKLTPQGSLPEASALSGLLGALGR